MQDGGTDGYTVYTDLSGVRALPVVAAAGKVVYSVHQYPLAQNGVSPVTYGTMRSGAWDKEFGYLIRTNAAPVWIGEMGCDCDGGQGTNMADDNAWGASITGYLNDTAAGGLPLSNTGDQPQGGDWWNFGYFTDGQYTNGIFNDAGHTTLKTDQENWWSTMLYTAGTPTPPPPTCSSTGSAPLTWSGTDKSATVAVSSDCKTASTSTGTGNQGVRGNISHSSGKFCVQEIATNLTALSRMGLADNFYNFTTATGADNHAMGFNPFAGPQSLWFGGVEEMVGGGNTAANGDITTMCEDITLGKVWVSDTVMQSDHGGAIWNKDATANPATGVGGLSMAAMAGVATFPLYDNSDAGASIIINGDAFVSGSGVALPSGFAVWNGTAPPSLPYPITIQTGSQPICLLFGTTQIEMNAGVATIVVPPAVCTPGP